MSDDTKFTEEEIQDCLKAYEKALRTGSPEGIEVWCGYSWEDQEWGNRFLKNYKYRLKP